MNPLPDEKLPGESKAPEDSTRADAASLTRRPAVRVLVISGFIVATVWIVRYAGEVRTVLESAPGNQWSWRLLGDALDPYLIARACPTKLLAVLAAVVSFFMLLRLEAVRPIERRFLEILAGARRPTQADDEAAGQGGRAVERPWAWLGLGLVTVAVAFFMLQWIELFYFVQDDNFANVLPSILQGCRSIVRGEFPDFDPCQLMGMPNAGKGIYTLLYPPTVASYAIARWLLGDECLTLDVFAALHLLAGFVMSFAAARMAGLRPALAYVLGISFVLSGYILLVGRAWHAVVTLAFWLPALFCCMESWLNGRANWRWLLTTGLAIGAFYYTGFAQYWFYGMFLLAVAAVSAVLCGRIAARQLVWPAAASLLGLAIILPTLVVQLEITRGMAEKPANAGAGVEQGLLAVLLPFPLSRAGGFMGLPANRDPALETQWYYSGTILMAAAYLGLGALLAYRWRRLWLARQPWLVTALFSLWLGLGSEGLLWAFMGRLPVIRAVNHHPHRLLPFFVFFSLIVGGILLERLLRMTASRNWERLIALVAAGLMLYHVSLARNTLWCYGDRPYPKLPDKIAACVLPADGSHPGRVTWHGPWRSGLAGYSRLLPLSLPSAYGVYGFSGYDPIIEARPESDAILARFVESPLDASRAYGIRWWLIANPDYFRQDRSYWQTVWKTDWCSGYMDAESPDPAKEIIRSARLRASLDEVRLYELDDVCPLAFDRADPKAPLAIRFYGWGAEVESPGAVERTIVVNLAYRPWIRAASGDMRLEAMPDDWGRIEVRVPAGVTRFRVFYQLPWLKGVLAGIGLAATILIGLAVSGGIARGGWPVPRSLAASPSQETPPAGNMI